METHYIEKCTINIEMDSEEKSMQIQSFISSFIKERAMPIVDEVFTKVNYDRNKHVCMDKLEINLGNIDFEDFKPQFENKLKEQLLLQIGREIYLASAHVSKNTLFKEHTHTKLEKLILFMLYGFFPWTSDKLTNHVALLSNLLEDNPNELIAAFRKYASRKYFIQRFIYQFPEEYLQEIIKKIDSANAFFIISYKIDVNKTYQYNPVKNLSNQDFEHLTWELIYKYLLIERGSDFNRIMFVKWNLQQYAKRFSVSYEALLEKFTVALEQLKNKKGSSSGLLGILSRLKQEKDKAGRSPDEGSSALDRIQHILQNCTVHKIDKTTFDETFKVAATESQEALVSFLEKYGKKDNNRRYLVKSLNTSQLRKLVRLVEPQNATFIINYEIDIDKSSYAKPFNKTNEHSFREVRWEFILAYLLEERGSIFNRKAFVKNNLNKLSAHLNISYFSLLVMFTRGVEKQNVNFRLSKQLPGLLLELKEEAKTEKSFRLTLLKENQEKIVTCGIYEELKCILFSGYSSNRHEAKNKKPDELIDALLKDNPQELIKLKNELKAKPYIKISRQTTEKLFLKLIEAILSVSTTFNLSTSRNFIDAIIKSAESIKNKKVFFTHIIYALVQEQNIDVKQIVDKTNNSSKNVLLDNKDRPSVLMHEIRSRLDRYQVSKTAHAEILELLMQLFQGYPVKREAFIKELSKSKKQSKKITHLINASSGLGLSASTSTFIQARKEYFNEVLAASRRKQKKKRALQILKLIELFEQPDQATKTDSILSEIHSLVEVYPQKMSFVFGNLIQDEELRNKWVEKFPEQTILQIINTLQPVYFDRIISTANIIWNSFVQVTKDSQKPEEKTKLKFILEYLAKNKSRPFNLKNFIAEYFESLSKTIQNNKKEEFFTEMLHNIPTSNKHYSLNQVQSVIQTLEKVKKEESMNTIEEKQKLKETEKPREEYIASPDAIYINNAGMVLAGVYLPMLFNKLSLIDNSEFKDFASQEKAIHLLQYMVNESIDSPEYFLALNKILCGVEIEMPIREKINITEKERSVVNSLIKAMIENWRSIGSTSVEGFRGSFLQREGKLFKDKGNWNLLVEEKAYDMLLDQLPWNISTIKHPWMKNLLYVHWR